MKKFVFSVVFLLAAVGVKAQYEHWEGANDLVSGGAHLCINGGVGLALQNNYDVSPSGGFDIYFPVKHTFYFGLQIQYSRLSQYFSHTAPDAAYGEGYGGYTVLDQNDYVFVAPELLIPFGPKSFRNKFVFYMNAGVGFLGGSKEIIHKWDSTYNYPLNSVSSYDSSIANSKNVFSMIYRYGFGFTEQSPNRKYRTYFTFTEDFSFIGSPFSPATSTSNPNKNSYSPSGVVPLYFTFKVGVNFFHHKHMRH